MRFLLPFLLACAALAGCSKGFEPVAYGREACAHCRMTIMDPHYASELITPKGKVFKFDDVACMKQYIREQQLGEPGLVLFVADFTQPGGAFLDARKASFVRSEAFASPMNGNCAAFATAEAARNNQRDKDAQLVTWSSL